MNPRKNLVDLLNCALWTMSALPKWHRLILVKGHVTGEKCRFHCHPIFQTAKDKRKLTSRVNCGFCLKWL
jgi:hypothetical protein